MQRRDFLANLIGLSGVTLAAATTSVFAQGSMRHAMTGMGHMKGMHGMTPMSGMGESESTLQLAATSAVPPGHPLAPLAVLRNEATEAGKFRATLVAAPTRLSLIPGKTTDAWTYNGIFPGPLIELTAGDEVEITLHNRLAQPTTIHWHGLPVPADQDGNPVNAVPPGGSQVYRFKLPETVNGLYWYHPHPHELSAEQVYRGLAGAILVRDKNDPLAGMPERVLAVTDLRLATDGSIPSNDMMDWMNGREGQFALINGQHRPVLHFDHSGRERWRILNATNARYLRLQLPGHTFTLVGTDGGLIERPQAGLQEILVTPAQRVDLVVTATDQRKSQLIAATYDRGKMGSMADAPPIVLLDIAFDAEPHGARAPLPAVLRAFPPLPPAIGRKRVIMSESMSMDSVPMRSMSMKPGHSMMQFLLNGKSFDMRRIDLVSRAGVWEEWEIINDSGMDHPFHLHGTQFMVIERMLGRQRSKAPFRAWYDTVNLRPKETVRIKAMQPTRGIRMFHCHILEHEDLGMMGQLDVI